MTAPAYVMSYGVPLDPHRVESFFKGELDQNELISFAQDVIEAGESRTRGPNVYALVMHYLAQNLCTLPGRLV